MPPRRQRDPDTAAAAGERPKNEAQDTACVDAQTIKENCIAYETTMDSWFAAMNVAAGQDVQRLQTILEE